MKLRLGPLRVNIRMVPRSEMEDQGRASSEYAEILIRDDLDPHQMMLVLFHEVGHIWDHALLGDAIERRMGKLEDPFLNQLASAIHMTLLDNWKEFRELYDGLAKGK